MSLFRVKAALTALRAGRFVVVADDQDRENEGDLILAAESMTTARLAFMLRHTSGVVCVALTRARCQSLALPLMVPEHNNEPQRTQFTVSVDAAVGTTTGISAEERAHTIRSLADAKLGPKAFLRPGHVFPLRARPQGVLERRGHTEAAVDLARLAGVYPGGVICEILNEDGSTARRPQLEAFAREHGLTFITVAQLVAHRLRNERLVHRVAEARLPTAFGTWKVYGYKNDVDTREHVAIAFGDVSDGEGVLVRMHSKCLTGDVFHSLRCDCGWQLETAMQMIQKEGRGVIVYLDQEGRGIGLLNKLKAYELQDAGADTVEANERLGFAPDLRNYGIGAQILLDLGLRSIRPITNNPRKMVGLEGYGLHVDERVPIVQPENVENAGYMGTKRDKLGHLLAS